ncbi:MAG TPA: hypothetical protein VNQ90_04300 [Chthoniobacteraceae bacterium]|nr:hypothetical protein [Chthoniobacteraceae bacterium]
MTRPLLPLLAHFDLKGVLPRERHLLRHLDSLKSLGFQGVLVEYEEVFPFETVSLASHPEDRWSRAFLQEFLDHAAALELEIVPLQQCLGHLEYAFVHEAHRPFALPSQPLKDLHIGRPEAVEWMKAILGEIIAAHPRSRHIHLGLDEAHTLRAYAEEAGRQPLELFLDYLESLCTFCEAHGKKPLIWSDMLEEHYDPALLDRLLALRDRLILVPWDYSNDRNPPALVRFCGVRLSRRWLDEPLHPDAPPLPPALYESLPALEEWPPAVAELMSDFMASPWTVQPFFPARLWKRFGFTVWGASASATSQDGTLLPCYQRRMNNLSAWKEQAGHLDALIVTQWGRSNSLTVPNLIPEVCWPLLAFAACGTPAAFFPEIDARTVEALFLLIGQARENWCFTGKCRNNWQIENRLIAEMKRLLPLTGARRYEWETILLMVAIMRENKALHAAMEQIRRYEGIGRLPAEGWEPHRRRLVDFTEKWSQRETEARRHLEEGYHGTALREWFHTVFTNGRREAGRGLASINASAALKN